MINKKSKFYILSKGQDSYSADRIKEEFKGEAFEFVNLNFNNIIVTSEGLFWKDKLIVLNKGDVLWSVNNSSMTRFVLSSVKRAEGSFLWPDPVVFELANKFKGNRFLSKIGIKTPKTVLVSMFDYDNLINKTGLNFPLVLKKNYGSKGESVYLVENLTDIRNAIEDMFLEKSDSTPIKNSSFILQEFIEESKGSDYRVLCLGGEILGGIKRTSQSDFRANISLGGKAEKFEVDDDLVAICRNIMEKGKIFYAGIDFIKRGGEWLAIEINTCAQFQGFEKATGVNVAKKIIEKLTK